MKERRPRKEREDEERIKDMEAEMEAEKGTCFAGNNGRMPETRSTLVTNHH